MKRIFAITTLVHVARQTSAAVLPAADSNDNKLLLARAAGQATSHSNFSAYCGDVTPRGASTSTISAWCSQSGYNLAAAVDLYESHIDLSQCLANTGGIISAMTDGNAMASCRLGKQGRQVCTGCAETIAIITCGDYSGKDHDNKVDLDDYIGVEWQDITGDKSVPVLSCTLPSAKEDNRGVYDGCQKLGATC